MPIRQPWLDFKTEVIKTLPASSGVFELGDQAKNVLMIKGADNVQQTVLELKNSGEPSIEKVCSAHRVCPLSIELSPPLSFGFIWSAHNSMLSALPLPQTTHL